MIIEARGRKVVVRDGPSTKTLTFPSADAALDHAAELEAERFDALKTRVACLAAYADPAHPADPVLPRPGELLRWLAEIHNYEHEDDPVELPAWFDDTSDEGVLRDRTLALLAAVRDGTYTPEAPAPAPEPPAVAPGDSSGQPPDTVPAPSGPVADLQFEYDPTADRLTAVVTSLTAATIDLDRAVTDPNGDKVRGGTSKLPAGRVLTRHYNLDPGQTIEFTHDGTKIASYTAAPGTTHPTDRVP